MLLSARTGTTAVKSWADTWLDGTVGRDSSAPAGLIGSGVTAGETALYKKIAERLDTKNMVL